ncbi:GYF domain-containing-like protein isoform 1 [Hibiscus syriacus]|uniref:GYF domain-containing-like protein isoform 1 n=1 Tax=Hibiscus syriacus TaxID=106335 RepID=A0A6A3BM07_HIBSY|nr:cation/H(+) antiporter 15-like [Hibiscus syriacus]KAE8715879.1 GYF domain-containing-like protein isoform 1 [Hibiscus syriacus]
MEPDLIRVFGSMPKTLLTKNPSLVCSNFSGLSHASIFENSSPFTFMLPLLMLQLALASAAILITFSLLRRLGLPLMFAQILGGMLVGPSMLSKIPGFFSTIFPIRSFLIMNVVSTMGFMFYFFLIGVQTDVWMLKKITKKTFAIGFFTVAVPMILTMATALVWMQFEDPIDKRIDQLLEIAKAESMVSYSMVTYYLSELRAINSEVGRVAVCSSMVSTLCSLCVITSNVLWTDSEDDVLLFFEWICCIVIFAALVCCTLGPILLWEMKQTLGGQPLKQGNLVVLFVAVLMSGFWARSFGVNIYFGPYLFGLLIPSGPPLGSALVAKLDVITNWMLLPLFFVKFGLPIDIFAIRFKIYFKVQFYSLLGAFGKFLGASLSAVSCQMPQRDAISLGFFMTFQGIFELILYKLMKRKGLIGHEAFTAMCLSVLISTAVVASILRCYYDSSRRHRDYIGRSVLQSRPNSRLRVLVCIHEEQNVPSAINLLATLSPGKQSPIVVYMLHIIEMIGAGSPLLIPHRKTRRVSPKTRGSGPVINAFKNFEETHAGLVSVYPFISVSPTQAMHDDVCEIALEKGTSLVIIPFYKKFHVGGAVYLSKMSLKIANQNVLNQAPCSVAILVDRGTLKTLHAIWPCWSSSEVAVVFLGGADDREALALGARMNLCQNINLALVRIRYDGNFPDKTVEEIRLDNESLAQFQTNISGNNCTKYIEEVVNNETTTSKFLHTLDNHYDMVVVGRRHYNASPLLSGLTEWNENSELGAIGDMLASSDFLGNTTILVVQQHTDSGHDK